jgi:hypothetical protein
LSLQAKDVVADRKWLEGFRAESGIDSPARIQDAYLQKCVMLVRARIRFPLSSCCSSSCWNQRLLHTMQYEKYCLLHASNPGISMGPPYCIDAAWHAHMVHTVFYQQDGMHGFRVLLWAASNRLAVMALCGHVIEHSPWPSPEPSKEDIAAAYRLWHKTWGEDLQDAVDSLRAETEVA